MEPTGGGAARSTVDAGGPVPVDLRLPPAVDLELVVKHSATDADAGRPEADVPPVADGGRAGPETLGDFLGAEQSDVHACLPGQQPPKARQPRTLRRRHTAPIAVISGRNSKGDPTARGAAMSPRYVTPCPVGLKGVK